MHLLSLLFVPLFIATAVFATPLNITGTVKAISETGDPVENAVVLLKVNNDLIAHARTQSDKDGNFTLLPGKDAPGEITHTIKRPIILPTKFASYAVMDLRGRAHPLNNLPQGIYVLLGKTETGKTINLGTIYHKGGTLNPTSLPTPYALLPKPLSKVTTTVGEVQLIVRKTGYLPEEVSFSSFDENVGTVILRRDPLEDRIDSVLSLMNLADKIYQMTQPEVGRISNYVSAQGNIYGSALHGGDTYSSTVLSTAYTNMMSNNNTRVKIPTSYGKDMMHGAAAIRGATVFPHNIGMGATRDSALVRRACEITAKESWAGANVDLIFGPSIAVPQDERWGRVYEGFGETAELAVMMGAACVRGLQGDKYDAPWRVIATAKHYLADGSTTNGVDRGGNDNITDDELKAIHLPGYEAVIEQGVLSIMASFNQIRGVHQHVDSLRLTGWLKTDLGFDGYVISDWQGIANSTCFGCHGDYGSQSMTASREAVRNAINAGIDLAMEPMGSHTSFINNLTALANNGEVSMERIDDAVRRILRAKFRAGRMDNPNSADTRNMIIATYGNYGSAEHRAVAREAVRKSLVLLKNENSALPISKDARVFVTGGHANDHGRLCGGWTAVGTSGTPTNGWQGASGRMTGATSIQEGIDSVAPGARVTTAEAADVIIYATGELPYAEWRGDRTLAQLNFTDAQLATLRNQNPDKKIVVIFISGRAMVVENLLENSDAFVAAWLPGTEGDGIAEVLFGGDYGFTGKLPFTWPRTTSVIPINSTEESPNWFPYGFGLTY
ncbi:MAG: glycoside hydrolase family 3 C-terminal domain-containing protein [Fibromonadaceae bacterium]|jgi:beta-glucosidase|nr:glycoside hydrolase family 3 C-terminal domain-containing protein [Fibromonadaceae bacterium]